MTVNNKDTVLYMIILLEVLALTAYMAIISQFSVSGAALVMCVVGMPLSGFIVKWLFEKGLDT